MRRSGGVAAVVALLAAAPTVFAEPWLTRGHDASRSAYTPDAGPEFDDVALNVTLPGMRREGSPLFIDGSVYVLTDTNGSVPELDTNGLFRVDVDTAEVALLVNFSYRPQTFASDGERFFVMRNGGMDVYSMDGSGPQWSWEHPTLVQTSHVGTSCAVPAARDGTVYVGCTETGGAPRDAPITGPVPPTCTALNARPFVAAIEASSGRPRWLWAQQALEDEDVPGGLPAAPMSTSSQSQLVDFSVLGPYVLAVVRHDVQTRGTASFDVLALREADGGLIWSRNTSFETTASESASSINQSRTQTICGTVVPQPVLLTTPSPGTITGTPNVAYVRHEAFIEALNPARGTPIWSEDIRKEDARFGSDGAAGFALSPEAVYAASQQTIFKFDAASRTNLWRFALDPAMTDTTWGGSALAVGGDTLYARACCPGDTQANVLYAIDVETALVKWNHTFVSSHFPQVLGPMVRYAVSGEHLAVALSDGRVVVLGQTAASPRAAASVSTNYPAPGEAVRIDLAGSAPGLGGAPTAYAADWGDGTRTAWQASPRLEHAYAEKGTYRARLMVRNDGGQTASVAAHMLVGEVEPTFLSRAFSAESQNLTFFVIGLALTGAGAAVGVLRVSGRRRRLARELAAVDRVFRDTKTRPTDCEAALAERKAHARGLLADGELDEAQMKVLAEHVDGLRRDLRLAEVEEELHFLPHGLVLAMQEVLADGRVTKWERDQFIAALDKDELLPPDYKARVRERIEAWYARDRGAKR